MDFQELIAIIAKILDDFDVPYAITGGYAVSVWGRVRATYDIDVIVNLFPSKVKVVKEALQKISETAYIDEDAIMEAVNRQSEFNFIHPDSGIKVDFFVRNRDQMAKLGLKRRIPVERNNQKIYMISPEDLILNKLLWYEKTHSERQLDDIKSVLKIQGRKIDFKYLKKISKAQSTFDILDKLSNK